ncbi:MAG TPA: glycosyltransferase family 39 protein, partial [Phycisphaerae bacterium]|nr:glycosyltransferase family 39 protein [Phycisphaerae bacterium]
MSRTISPFSYRLSAAAIATLFAIGLTNDLSEPWIGLHDWNGAFYSQLARNLIRYPSEIHHGLGIVAMGAAVPPPEERSIYATHPPGIVWLVAGAFRVLGESEAVARCVPILFSLGTILLLMNVVKRRYGPIIALLTGLIYALTPLCVYFGRMVDQEPPCLFFMLAAVAGWDRVGASESRGWAIPVWGFSMAAMIVIDWAGVLFAGLFGLWLILIDRRQRLRTTLAATWLFICVAAMLIYLVYAGFNGRWADLWAVFT